MVAHNAERYIAEALASLWSQTFADFEVIVVDDASDDRTLRIIAACGDRRLRLIRNEQRQGQTKSRVCGWSAARGKYIAILDADYIALAHRLEKQIGCLAAHREIAIIGSAAILIEETGTQIGLRRMPIADLDIRWASLFRNPFIHSSVMVRVETMRQYDLVYDERLEVCQDYELWLRVLAKGQAVNWREPLIKLRLHTQSVSAKAKDKQAAQRLALSHQALQGLLPDITAQQAADIYRLFIAGEAIANPAEAIAHYLQILEAFAAREACHAGIRGLRCREILRALCAGWRRLSWPQWLALAKETGRRFFFSSPRTPCCDDHENRAKL